MTRVLLRNLWLLGLLSACQREPEQAPASTGPSGHALQPVSAQSKVSGCAAQSKAAQAETPPVSKRSAGPLPNPHVSVEAGGIVVVHPFSHQCCLEAKTETTVKGSEVAIVTTLSGMGCRCLCSSKIETTVGLEPGGYTVTVTLVTPSGGPREELREQVTVVKR